MKEQNKFDAIVVGGSYSGLATAMALGRALRKTLLIDSGNPCNSQTPHSHNFLTRDGETPHDIAAIAREQVEKYDTVSFVNDLALSAIKHNTGFAIVTATGETFTGRKLIFATGIRDVIPAIPGFAECWGISLIHCPYCHGYEVRKQATGILGNGDYGYDFSTLISNWTSDLTLFTNGRSALTTVQTAKLREHNIRIVEDEVENLEHKNGWLQQINFKNGQSTPLTALYTRTPFLQHCPIPDSLGCALTDDGYIQVDAAQKSTVHGVFAGGDCTTRMRTVANAVSMGTTAGMMANKELIDEDF